MEFLGGLGYYQLVINGCAVMISAVFTEGPKIFMRNVIFSALSGCVLLSGCASYSGNATNEYDTYNCNQLSMEKYALEDEMQQAEGAQSTNQIYQLAMAAFAMSNGDSYSTRPDTHKTEQLQAQFNAARQEAIRKQCNW